MVTRSAVLTGSAIAVAIALLLLDLFDLITNTSTLRHQFGVDYSLYIDTAARWLHGGPYFQPHQLQGPYEISAGDVLYPPIGLLLFVPFTVLPAILWWALPGAAIVWSLNRLRPARSAWLWIAACVAWPTTPLKIITGNPVIWAVGAMALGVVYAWPSVLVLIKPSLFPFALFGAWNRRWWAALVCLVVIALPFGSLWLDWVRSVLNSQGGGVAYSILEVPMLAIPVIAWCGRTTGAGTIGWLRGRTIDPIVHA
jgi:hypothetical protein